MPFWEALTLVAYIVMVFGVYAQIKRVFTRKSAMDIALTEVGARWLAMIILIIKFWTMPNQEWVAAGHTVLTTSFTVYACFAIKYRLAARRAARRSPPG